MFRSKPPIDWTQYRIVRSFTVGMYDAQYCYPAAGWSTFSRANHSIKAAEREIRRHAKRTEESRKWRPGEVVEG